jgi:hypothetical protein
MKFRIKAWLVILLVCADLSLAKLAIPQENSGASPTTLPKKLTLVTATMCEKIAGVAPLNEAIVFSVAIGKVSCFTSFDPVPEQTVIYHQWFYRDKLTTKRKLTLQTPRWSSFSSIQLRDVDKGPWRVEVTDAEGNSMKTLRFSITD